jgi:ATP-binding cassette subfamily C protein
MNARAAFEMNVPSADGLTILEREGERRAVAGNRPLTLDDERVVWRVVAGQVDLFAAPLEAGQAVGPRRHLVRLAPGRLLFGSPSGPAGLGLMAVGLPGTEVVGFPRSRLAECLEADRRAIALLELWIQGVTASLARNPLPQRAVVLGEGSQRVAEGGCLTSGSGVLWVEGPAAFRFLGLQPVDAAGDPFPLAASGWLMVDQEALISSVTTLSLAAGGRLWRGLTEFHKAALAYVAEEAKRGAAAEQRRLGRVMQGDRQLMERAVGQLATVAAAEAVDAPADDAEPAPILAAIRLIGRQLGVEIRAPRNYREQSSSDPIATVARSSAIRVRRVMLTDDWWRQDNGPLLVFRADDDRPLAALPVSATAYELAAPGTGERTPIDRRQAESLGGWAYCFYRSLPARPLSARDIFVFGLAGTRRDWLTVGALGLAGGVLGLLLPLATAVIFGRFVPNLERDQLLLAVLGLVAAGLAAALFGFVQGVAMLRIEMRMDAGVEAGVWDRLLNLPASFFRRFAAGDLANRAMGIARIRQVLTEAAMTSLLSFVFSGVSFGLLFYYDVRLALLACLVFATIAGATLLGSLVQLRYERQHYQVRGRVAGLVLQLLCGISRLRVAAAEDRALAVWANQFSRQTRLAVQGQRVANNLATFMAAVPVLAGLTIFAAVSFLPGGALPLGQFLAFNAALAEIVGAAIMMSYSISSILDIVPLYERARPILEALPESHAARRDPGVLSGDIELNHVSFRYQPDTAPVLDDVSLQIHPGEFVALVGPSGAGKSTILRLLLGFETANSGSIYYDREDLAGLDLQALRRQIGVVLQSSKLTPGDILSNITGGAPRYTVDDAWHAARMAGLDQDIKQMPMGMYTAISEGESTLSGGQRQRLLVARAIIAAPRILLFDEATSALDNITQARVTESLTTLKATRIVVAHRLSTVIQADRICVIDRGRIVQHGAYQALVEQPGMFAELARRQLLS